MVSLGVSLHNTNDKCMNALAVCLIGSIFLGVRSMFLNVTIVYVELLLWQVFTEIRKLAV